MAQIEETGELEEVEAVWSSRKTRRCENTLLWLADYHAQDSQGMVKVAVKGVIDATLRAKCCCVVLSGGFVDLVAWRIDYPTLVVQANQRSVAQAECPPASVCTDPM
jgi:hypothetical protein